MARRWIHLALGKPLRKLRTMWLASRGYLLEELAHSRESDAMLFWFGAK